MGKLAAGSSDPFISFSLQLSENQTPSFSYSTGAPGSLSGVAGSNPIPIHTWTHLAAVMDGTTTRLLVNGVVVATGTAAGAPAAASSVPFSVGIALSETGGINFQFFPGYARQLRVWNVARTAAQITAALGESLPTERTGLVAAWPLDDAKGTAAVRDISGAGRDLAAGSLVALSPALLAAGPFYADTVSRAPDGSLLNLNGGTLIDFDSDGAIDFVGFQLGYTRQAAVATRLRAFRNVGGVFTDVTDAVLGTVTLVHPRSSVTGDFNGDGRADLMVVGHGYDFPPYPGEQSRLLIQTADGRLVDETTTRIPSRTSFTHRHRRRFKQRQSYPVQRRPGSLPALGTYGFAQSDIRFVFRDVTATAGLTFGPNENWVVWARAGVLGRETGAIASALLADFDGGRRQSLRAIADRARRSADRGFCRGRRRRLQIAPGSRRGPDALGLWRQRHTRRSVPGSRAAWRGE